MFRALTTITLAAAVGFVAARQLLSDETRLEGLPDGVRGPLMSARDGLIAARERTRVALQEGRQGRLEAEAELMARYREQAGRSTDVTQLPPGRLGV